MISVIVVDHQNLEYTKRCLESLYKTTYKDKEIIVVKNDSSGEARKYYISEMDKGNIIFKDYHWNHGLASASNLGAEYARGEYLFFLNNDTLVKEDIFEKLLEGAPDAAGCRMFDYKGEKELSSAISLDRFGCPAGNTGKMFYPDGAIFIKKDIFNEIGGFDEKLFLYGEDRDLCWRVWLAGYTIEYRPLAVFYHNSASVSDTNYFRRYHSEKNILRSMLKNYSRKELFLNLPQYFFWSVLELSYILLTKPQAICNSYIPAYLWNIFNFRDTIRLRRKVVRKATPPFSEKIGKLEVLLTQGVKWGKKRYMEEKSG